jgi:hypothetical protein
MRVLHLDNDQSADSNGRIGSEGIFRRLLAQGVLSDYARLTFLRDYRQSRDANSVQASIIERAVSFRPDMIFWQHVSDFPLNDAFFARLREVAGVAQLVYHEADVYGGLKRPSRAMRKLTAHADLVLTVSLGPASAWFRHHGARDIGFMPHCYDPARFGTPWQPGSKRPSDIVMIAGNYPSTIPGVYLPGGRKRASLAGHLTKIHGEKFRIYGSGWKHLASACGVLPFNRQEVALRESWVSVNWDHYDTYPHYFSNRLPIALAAGVVHVTNYHPGYDDQFAGCPGLYFARSVDEMVAKLDWLLSKPVSALIEEGLAAQAWVRDRLSGDIVYRQAMEMCAARIGGCDACP